MKLLPLIKTFFARWVQMMTFFAGLCVTHGALAQGGDTWTEFAYSEYSMIHQFYANDCGPAAIFNALHMNPDKFQKIIKSLPGETREEKYEAFFKKFSQKPSEFYSGRYMRTDYEVLGTQTVDMNFILADVMTSAGISEGYKGGYLHRQPNEKLGTFVRRIQAQLKTSLERGFPPVVSVAVYKEGQRRSGHFIAVSGVSEMEGDMFRIRGYDSKSHEAFSYWFKEESQFSFEGFIRELGNTESIKTLGPVATSQGRINSPFLKMRQAFDVPMDFLILESAFGSFE